MSYILNSYDDALENILRNGVKKVNNNVNQNKGWKLIHKCPVCLSKQSKKWLIKNNIDIVECLKCKTGYVKKIPKDLINDVYDTKIVFKKHLSSYEKIKD